MWLVLFLVLAGCHHPVLHATKLDDDELGKATACHWKDETPTDCGYDQSRVTIEKDFLQGLLDRLREYKQDAVKRRSL